MRVWGSFEMNPTVSVMRTVLASERESFLVVGSRVANSLFSTKTSAPVRAFSKLDFPAFV